MSAHVLLNLLNKLRKRDNMCASDEHFITFSQHFDKFNNTGPLLLDSIYHNTNIILNHIFDVKISRFYHIDVTLCASSHNVTKVCNPLVVHLF